MAGLLAGEGVHSPVALPEVLGRYEVLTPTGWNFRGIWFPGVV